MALEPARDSGIVAFYVFHLTVGIAANVFFLCLLLFVDKQWSVGKKLMVLVHGNELLLLCSSLFPFTAAMARNGPLPSDHCILPSALFHISSMLEPLSIVLMAHVRWRLVCTAKTGVMHMGSIKFKPYLLALFAVLTVILIADFGSSYGQHLRPVWGNFFVCIQPGDVYLIGIFIIVFASAPYVIFCSYKVTKTVKDQIDESLGQKQAQLKEAVRLIVVQTASYYTFHSPWFIAVFINWYVQTVPARVYQSLITLYLLHATLSPFVSIAVTERYRNAARSIFHGRLSIHSSGSDFYATAKKASRLKATSKDAQDIRPMSKSSSEWNSSPSEATKVTQSRTQSPLQSVPLPCATVESV